MLTVGAQIVRRLHFRQPGSATLLRQLPQLSNTMRRLGNLGRARRTNFFRTRHEGDSLAVARAGHGVSGQKGHAVFTVPAES